MCSYILIQKKGTKMGKKGKSQNWKGPKKCQSVLQNAHKWAKTASSTLPWHCLRLVFMSSKTKQPFCHVKANCSCKKKRKTLPGISSTDTLVANQFFMTSCLRCPQDQTAAEKYYGGQNISTNSDFLQAPEERKQHWQTCSSVLYIQGATALILNE